MPNYARLLGKRYFGPGNPFDEDYRRKFPYRTLSGEEKDAYIHDAEVSNNYGYLINNNQKDTDADWRMARRSWNRWKKEGNRLSLLAAIGFGTKARLSEQFKNQFYTQPDEPQGRGDQVEGTQALVRYQERPGQKAKRRKSYYRRMPHSQFSKKRRAAYRRRANYHRKRFRAISRTIAKVLTAPHKVSKTYYCTWYSSSATDDSYIITPEILSTTGAGVNAANHFNDISLMQYYAQEAMQNATALETPDDSLWLLNYLRRIKLSNATNGIIYLRIYFVYAKEPTGQSVLEALDDYVANTTIFPDNSGSNIASVGTGSHWATVQRNTRWTKLPGFTESYFVQRSYPIKLEPNGQHTFKQGSYKPLLLEYRHWRAGTFLGNRIPFILIKVTPELTADGTAGGSVAFAPPKLAIEYTHETTWASRVQNQKTYNFLSETSGTNYNVGTDPKFLRDDANAAEIDDVKI